MNIPKVRDLLMRVRVLLEEDVEELGEDQTRRHCACIDEIDAVLEESKPS